VTDVAPGQLRIARSYGWRLAQLCLWPAEFVIIFLPVNALENPTGKPLIDVIYQIVAWGVVVVTLPALVPSTRAALSRPRLALAPGELGLHDSCLFRGVVSIPADTVAEIRVVDWSSTLPSSGFGLSFAEITPFVEPMTVEIAFSRPRQLVEARAGLLGNWLWRVAIRANAKVPRVPDPFTQYESVRLRLSESSVASLMAWADAAG
jgi:hypothetical protein